MRNALVTGVSRRIGIGYAITRRLLEDGHAVFVQGWSAHDDAKPWGGEPGGTEAVAHELGVPFVEADFADPAAPARVVQAAQDALGPLDILVANHARSGHGRLGTSPPSMWTTSCTRTSVRRSFSSRSSPTATTIPATVAASSS